MSKPCICNAAAHNAPIFAAVIGTFTVAQGLQGPSFWAPNGFAVGFKRAICRALCALASLALVACGSTAAVVPSDGPRSHLSVAQFANYHSFLKGIDQTGNILWSVQMTDPMETAAAMNNGVAFAGLDDALVAVNARTGAVLWQYPAPAQVIAEPVIVPSGLYMADDAGNVYAFAPPYLTSNGTSFTART